MLNLMQTAPEHVPLIRAPLAVCFDESTGATIRNVLLRNASLFVEASAHDADVIIFGSDELSVFKRNSNYESYRSRCICITESDIPTFKLPGLYAANEKSFVARSRALTMNYFISERETPNPQVHELARQPRTEKKYLYSFMGGTNSWARRRLLRAVRTTADTFIEPTDSYNHWTNSPESIAAKSAQQRRYADVLAGSKYALCPRGCGLSSYRLFEAMSLGVAPVIISDKWQPTHNVDWSFAIFLPERHISDADKIVRSHENEWEQRSRVAAQVYQNVFSDAVITQTLHTQITDILISYNFIRESMMQVATQIRVVNREAYWTLYRQAKILTLKGFALAGRDFPFRVREQMKGTPSAPDAARVTISASD